MTFKITVKPIIPRDLGLDEKSINKAVENALTQSALAIKADFGVTTQTWKNKPVFTIEKGAYSRIVSTDNMIFLFVDAGTKPHIIRPKKAKALAFQGGPYTPKTRVNQIASYNGGPSGDVVKRKEVKHPGTEAREFAKAIGKKWEAEWPKQMDRALAAVIK